LALIGSLIQPGFVAADDINAGGLPIKNITIEKVEGDRLYYKTQSGTASDKQINDRMKLTVTDEPNLIPAEDAFAAGKWADAVDGYQKVLRSGGKPWLKDFAALRLLKAGEKSERFDAVVNAYIHLLAKDPQTAKEIKLKYPEDPANAYLKTAAAQVEAAQAAEKDPGKSTMLTVFRMDIAKAMKDDATVMKLAAQLSKQSGPGGNTAIDPSTLAGIVDGKLSLIANTVDKKDYAAAQKGLDEVKPSVTEAKSQAEWLWLTAQTHEGVSGATKDVAIDYMRLVANYPTSDHAPQALLKTAAILEGLQDSKAAIAVYQQVARDYEGQPASAKAKENLQRLNAANK
jgi:TolA-binding protein